MHIVMLISNTCIIHISLLSEPPPAAPSGVMVDGVDDISVRVSWQTVDDADRYNVTFTEELGQGLCIFNIHITSVSFDAPSTSASIGVGRMLAKDDTNMLRAYTTYSITMVAESDMTGSSENSVAITVTTAQIRKWWKTTNSYITVITLTASVRLVFPVLILVFLIFLQVLQ